MADVYFSDELCELISWGTLEHEFLEWMVDEHIVCWTAECPDAPSKQAIVTRTDDLGVDEIVSMVDIWHCTEV